MGLSGIWLPVITPFKDGEIDYPSYKNLLQHYLQFDIQGIIPLGTTGEVPTISDKEFDEFIDFTLQEVNSELPVFVGAGGNDTAKVIKKVQKLQSMGVKGILSVSPYYNRPDQRGIYHHFEAIAKSTDMEIIVYNIPYRTGRNIENETLYKLAQISNIIGLKDSSGDIKQTTELLLNPPKDFDILTGEDAMFYTTLCLGGKGGILASAHLETQKFIDVFKAVKDQRIEDAITIWKTIYPWIPKLFAEPNPSPIKYVLAKQGLIQSDEVRMPLLPITEKLSAELDQYFTK